MSEQKQQIFEFDNFRLDLLNRTLLRDRSPVALPAKAFDVLVVLVESAGRLVEKDELFSRVWPDQIVEESNLTVHISAIRKVLGDRKDNPLAELLVRTKAHADSLAVGSGRFILDFWHRREPCCRVDRDIAVCADGAGPEGQR